MTTISFASLLDGAGLEELLLKTTDRLIPIEALEDFVEEIVATITDEIAQQLDTGCVVCLCRSGVALHNGSALRAPAVVYNKERLTNPAHPTHRSGFFNKVS